jgi:predicted Zn-dependent peptidase
LTALSVSSAAAQTFDRTQPPTLLPPAVLHLPPVQTGHLANGTRIYLVEMHEVPLVQVTLRVRAGGRYEGSRSGLAAFTVGMLDEGAGKRDAAGIAAEAGYLGARLSTETSWDIATVSLNTPRRTLGGALDLMADVALRPTFRGTDIRRERDLRLAEILQERSEPGSMAELAFNAVVFPDGHPYHRPLGGDSTSVAAFDSVLVQNFYRRTFQPDQAEFIVTGDITLAEAERELMARFGRWRSDRLARLKPADVPAPEATPTAVTLVSKPDAAQSVIIIGGPGVARSNPDYAAIEVMNTLLGGSYSSRLNQNLRETRGYTYGAFSDFLYRPLPGPFEASAAVRTDVTDSSLVQFFAEFHLLRDSAVSPTELHRAVSYITLGLPGQFETTGQMAGQIGTLLTFGLPATYYDDFSRQVVAVSAADVQRVARRYVEPARMSVVVVGDLARIRAGIEALGLGPVVVRDPTRPPRIP